MLSPLLLIAHHNGLLDASLLDPCPALIGVHHLEHYNDVWDTNDFDDNDNDGDIDDDLCPHHLRAHCLLHVHGEHAKPTAI